MMTAEAIAQQYFDFSNDSNFEQIKCMFKEDSTYRSGSGDLFLGANNIMSMQRRYHRSFKSLQWQVISIKEIKPSIVVVDFEFNGMTQAGEKVSYSGLESVVVFDGRIQHIDVCRK